ncbi:hypothetical protein COP1_006184 [Malus domestica]
MGDPLRSYRVSSQKQNYKGVVGAQSEQYRATAEPVWDVTEWYQSHSAVWCEYADEDVGPLREVNCNIPHRPTERGDMPYMHMPTSI